jgi:multidrug transporter EmrE-like cation transporter
MWLRLMLIAWVTNGIAQLGLKVLSAAGLAERYRYQYLMAWYISGFALSLVFVFRKPAVPYWKEIAIGATMAVCSVAGQACLAMALSSGAPGYVVFPLTSGANIFLVAAAGFLLFRERVGTTGLFGIVFGMLSIVILSLP